MPIDLDEFADLADVSSRGAKVSNEDLLESLADQALTTKEVSEILGVQSGTAYSRLRRLEKEGLVVRKFKANTGYWTAATE